MQILSVVKLHVFVIVIIICVEVVLDWFRCSTARPCTRLYVRHVRHIKIILVVLALLAATLQQSTGAEM